jgi:Cu2+-exporting ATPase
MAAHSRHPYSQALAAVGSSTAQPVFDQIREHAGLGLESRRGEVTYRLGRPDWAVPSRESRSASVVLSRNGIITAEFVFNDALRPDAKATVAALQRNGLASEILSGDCEDSVGNIAADLGVPYRARMTPRDKVAHIGALQTSGRKVLMVGDGLNDAPALAAAFVSMAPSSAADVGRNAADLVFMRDGLFAVPQAIAVARAAVRIVRQNLALAMAYNVIAVPIAVLGYATPLIAAIAMSLSSILVVANALRVKGPRATPAAAQPPLVASRPTPVGIAA